MQLNINLRCPNCGQAIPPKLMVTGDVRQKIVSVISEHSIEGITLREVADLVYSDSAAREEPRKTIWLLIRLANRQLRRQGYRIQTITRGRGARWVLRKIDANPKRKPARDQNTPSLEGIESTRTAGLY